MEGLMQPQQLRTRILLWTEEEIRLKRLPAKSSTILEAAANFRAPTSPVSLAPAKVRPAASPRRSLDAGYYCLTAAAPPGGLHSLQDSRHAGYPACFRK